MDDCTQIFATWNGVFQPATMSESTLRIGVYRECRTMREWEYRSNPQG
jgi:hypothetical protein